MLDANGDQVHYQKGTKVMYIQAYDNQRFCCVNDKDIYILEEIPEHREKSKDLDIDYQKSIPKKPTITAMNHPWRRMRFGNFVKEQSCRYFQHLNLVY